jgi:hypothetical protein
LPEGLDAEKAQATYRNGVLELRLPRREGAQPRRIPVRRPEAPAEQAADQQATDQKAAE